MPDLLLCIAGLPASGKSTVGALLAQHGWVRIETGKIAADLLGSQDFHSLPAEDQEAFRLRAMALVQGEHPNRLSQAMANLVPATGGRVVAVGVRHVSTFEGLKAVSPLPVQLLYVSTEPDVCAARYSQREKRAATDFYQALKSPTEADQPRLLALSDTRLDNNGPLVGLTDRLSLALEVLGIGLR